MKPTKCLCTVLLLVLTSVATAIAGPIELKLDTTKTGALISP